MEKPIYLTTNKGKFEEADKFYENSFKLLVWYTEEDIEIVLE